MHQIVREITSRKNFQKEKLYRFLNSPILVNPRNLVYQKVQRYDFVFENFINLMKRIRDDQRSGLDIVREKFVFFLTEGLKKDKMLLEKIQSNLQLVSPRAVLSRGFSIVEKKNREIVRDSGQVEVKEEITVTLYKGILECQVIKH